MLDMHCLCLFSGRCSVVTEKLFGLDIALLMQHAIHDVLLVWAAISGTATAVLLTGTSITVLSIIFTATVVRLGGKAFTF